MDELPDHARTNRAAWDAWADEYAERARLEWAAEAPSWGIFGVPEAELGVLPDDLAGLDVVELGCGTAYVCAWLARAGARPVGIDNSERQLATARAMQRSFGLDFPLHHGNAETTPFADASFDFAISEYGASIWCDPYRWIPEAARILRPGGRLTFLVNGTILVLCMPEAENEAAGDRLLRDYFGLHRMEWRDDDPPCVDFHLGYGDWIRLLRANGFEIEDLIEVRAPPGATTRHPFVTGAWAHRWPCEEIWKVRKCDDGG